MHASPPPSIQEKSSRRHDLEFPRISVVTPNFNQARYLETCIRSVVSQDYPNVEYFVVDGGSSDASVEIIRSYEPWLAGWSSRPDSGQSDALNRGFDQCSGEVLCWVCADDCLLPGTLRRVADHFRQDPRLDVLAGACECVHESERGMTIKRETLSSAGANWLETPYSQGIWQPSCFFRRRAIHRPQVVRNDLHYCMDRELWCHLTAGGAVWNFTDESFGLYRYTGNNKSVTGSNEIIREISLIFQSWAPHQRWLPGLLQALWLPAALRATHAANPGRMPSSSLRQQLLSSFTTAGLLACFTPAHVRALQREFFSYAYWNRPGATEPVANASEPHPATAG